MFTSPPSRGAWIEICYAWGVWITAWGRPPRGGRGLKLRYVYGYTATSASPPSRGAWIEIYRILHASLFDQSPPSRGAWIEIRAWKKLNAQSNGRPPRGGRGLKLSIPSIPAPMVRRPPRGGRGLKSCWCRGYQYPGQSPPSRGAWIEIRLTGQGADEIRVAPLAGGVD